MNPVSRPQLARLAETLSERRWSVLRALHEVRLASGGQLHRRFYEQTASGARSARRELHALSNINALHRLERQIGGRRAGSTGFVYALGPVGRRLLEYADGHGIDGGRSRYEPTTGFMDHALAVTEIWVGLHEYLTDSWTGEREVAADFRVERRAWRQFADLYGAPRFLKPDAELRLWRERLEQRYWIEVDRATERRAVIASKLATYSAYYRSGIEQARTGMFPLTVWLTVDEPRAEVLREEIAALTASEQRLFRVGLLSVASPILLSHERGQR